MTIKQFLPNLKQKYRKRIGKAFAAVYGHRVGGYKNYTQEDGFEVCDYTYEFLINNSKQILKRFAKKNPEADLTLVQVEKKKRKRIQGVQSVKVN